MCVSGRKRRAFLSPGEKGLRHEVRQRRREPDCSPHVLLMCLASSALLSLVVKGRAVVMQSRLWVASDQGDDYM